MVYESVMTQTVPRMTSREYLDSAPCTSEKSAATLAMVEISAHKKMNRYIVLMNAATSCMQRPNRVSAKSVTENPFLSPTNALIVGAMKIIKIAGDALANEYPNTPHHDNRVFAPISVVP